MAGKVVFYVLFCVVQVWWIQLLVYSTIHDDS